MQWKILFRLKCGENHCQEVNEPLVSKISYSKYWFLKRFCVKRFSFINIKISYVKWFLGCLCAVFLIYLTFMFGWSFSEKFDTFGEDFDLQNTFFLFDVLAFYAMHGDFARKNCFIMNLKILEYKFLRNSLKAQFKPFLKKFCSCIVSKVFQN